MLFISTSAYDHALKVTPCMPYRLSLYSDMSITFALQAVPW